MAKKRCGLCEKAVGGFYHNDWVEYPPICYACVMGLGKKFDLIREIAGRRCLGIGAMHMSVFIWSYCDGLHRM